MPANFSKRPLTFNAQADLLIDRGLDADKEKLTKFLTHVNYYHLAAYFEEYQIKKGEETKFKPNCSFESIINSYYFDLRLRNLLMLFLDKLEVSLGTVIANEFTVAYGDPFIYTDKRYFYQNKEHLYENFMKEVVALKNHAKSNFPEPILDHYHKYDTPHLPLWVLVELLPLGAIIILYKGLPLNIQRKIEVYYGLPNFFCIASMLELINGLRNRCAHHRKIFNFSQFSRHKITLPLKSQNSLCNDENMSWFHEDRSFFAITVLRYFIEYIPDLGNDISYFKNELSAIINEFGINPQRMGVDSSYDWINHPIWCV